jgi:hypothetical protein
MGDRLLLHNVKELHCTPAIMLDLLNAALTILSHISGSFLRTLQGFSLNLAIIIHPPPLFSCNSRGPFFSLSHDVLSLFVESLGDLRMRHCASSAIAANLRLSLRRTRPAACFTFRPPTITLTEIDHHTTRAPLRTDSWRHDSAGTEKSERRAAISAETGAHLISRSRNAS